MSKMPPILSLIIPVYNVEKYIKRCLDSVFQQNINEDYYEVIVVNDGTIDNSMSIVNEFAGRHQNLKILEQENQGLSAARNNGLSLARGDYVWFIDSDDWISENAFEVILPNFKKNNRVIATNLIYAYDEKTRNFNERELIDDIYISSRDYFNNFSVGAVQRYLIRRDFLLNIKLFFTIGIYHEDAEFGAILVYKAQKLLILRENLYYYYQREQGSIMSNWNIKNSTDYLKVFANLSLFHSQIVHREDKDFFNWYLFRVLLQAFPIKLVEKKNDIQEFYINTRVQLRKNAFYCLKFSGKSFKRILAISIFLISPIIYNKLLRVIKVKQS